MNQTGVLIGTSGWQYNHWRGVLYEPGLPQKLWLQRYTESFETVEVNNTFYRLPDKSVFEKWGAETPEGFIFALKLSRYLSHIKRLRDSEESVRLFLERAAGMPPEKTGPLLLQLPPGMKAVPGLLQETLRQFPSHHRIALEVRDASWFNDEIAAILRDTNCALVLSNRDGKWLEPEWQTADWGYIRLHSGRSPGGGYGEQAMSSMRDLIARLSRSWRTTYVYFNNDMGGHAVRNALWLKKALA